LPAVWNDCGKSVNKQSIHLKLEPMDVVEPNSGLIALVLAILIPLLIIGLAVAVLMIVSIWYVFVKAAEPGWAILIPIYNILIMIKIAGKPWWFILLMLIPIVNIVIEIMVLHGISKNFGKDAGFTVGLVLLGFIFFPILGFGKSQYIGDKSAFA
jgi:hypothetical protein